MVSASVSDSDPSWSDSSRVGDIDIDRLAGKWRHAKMGIALRRKKTVPCTLRNDYDRSGVKLKGLGRAVIAHQFQRRAAVEDVDQFVAGEMAFPMILPRRLER